MSTEMAADQLFAAIRFMFREGIVYRDLHDELQERINKWAERQIVDESLAFGIECRNGACEV